MRVKGTKARWRVCAHVCNCEVRWTDKVVEGEQHGVSNKEES